jgi:hypothetical protein
MSSTSIVIVLELELNQPADCPTGRIGLQGRATRVFHGWLGLAEAITALTGDAGDVPASTIPNPPLTEGDSP